MAPRLLLAPLLFGAAACLTELCNGTSGTSGAGQVPLPVLGTTYTAYPNHDCNQDDAECEPFFSCRDANGTCIKCCDPATDGDAGCLRKLEAACNSNAVPFGKSSTFTCIGFGYAPPGNPGLLKQVRLFSVRTVHTISKC